MGGKGHRLFGPAVPQFLEKNVTSSKRAMVDVDHRVTDVEAGGLCLGRDERNCDRSVTWQTPCRYSLRRSETNRMAEGRLGADATARAEPMIQNPVCRVYLAVVAPFQRAVRASSDIACS